MAIFDAIVSKFHYSGGHCVYKRLWRIRTNPFLHVPTCSNFLKMWHLKRKSIFLKTEFLDIYLASLKFWKVSFWGARVASKPIKSTRFLKCAKHYSWSRIWSHLSTLYCTNLIIFASSVRAIILCNRASLVETEAVDLVNSLVYPLSKINWQQLISSLVWNFTQA